MILRAYIDDTGTHDSKGEQPGSDVAGAVGYVATQSGWRRLNLGWRAILRKYGVKAFHAVDVRRRRGEFRGWTDKKSEDFVNDLAQVANKFTSFGVGGLLLVKDYAAMPDLLRDETKHPFYVCLRDLFWEFIRDPLASELSGKRVDFVFDEFRQFSGETRKVFDKFKAERNQSRIFGSIDFDTEGIELQAADLLAYFVRAEISRMTYKSHLNILDAMTRLNSGRLNIVYSTQKNLSDLYFAIKIERARRGGAL
jgi:hypothetical protein